MMLANDVAAVATYFYFRLAFGTYLTDKVFRDIYAMWSSVRTFFAVATLMGIFTTHTLNFYWFYKLCKSAARSLSVSKQAVRKKN